MNCIEDTRKTFVRGYVVIIGVINAKHVGAKNASYAIKASYLKNLIELLPNPPRLQNNSMLIGKPLTTQVEISKRLVYIIETE